MKTILVIATENDVIDKIRLSFPSDVQIDISSDNQDALGRVQKRRYDLVFCDLEILMAQAVAGSYRDALAPYQRIFPLVQIIVMAPQKMIRQAVMAVKAGASDYLTYPIESSEISYIAENVERSAILMSELDYFRERFWKTDALDFVQTRNQGMKTVFQKIQSVAPTRSPVLLSGETGTGKGLMAKLIHRHSNRAESQFISVHCGAIPDTLLESELYGYEKGAFTGASRRKLGKFEISNNGTIFLDEIGTISPPGQIKLLQVLQDGTYSRIGGEEILKTNARVISATNSNLKQMTEEGQFRKDLYYRLNVFPVEIPPLRERKEDIPLLTDYFLRKLNADFQKEIRDVSIEVREAFQRYCWPGNIRELENLLERAYILENGSQLTPGSFPKELFEDSTFQENGTEHDIRPLAEARRKSTEAFETEYLKELMARNRGKINKSAKDAGITPRQLHKLMVKYGLRKEEFKGKTDTDFNRSGGN